MKQASHFPVITLSQFHEYRADIERCVKCGTCRSVCPSFLASREESLSARGRIALVKAVLDGRLAVSEIFRDRLATCTTCLACEDSCPGGVKVTEIIQAAKEQAIAECGPGIIGSLLSGIVKRPALFRAAAWLAPIALHYSKYETGGQLRSQFKVQNPRTSECEGKKIPGGTAAFFPGCAINYFQTDIGESAISVLNAAGYEVVVPDELKCCGRPLLSLGDRRGAEEVAAWNNAVFSRLGADVVVTACASCGLTFKREYPKLLAHTKTIPVLDIHEFLSSELVKLTLGPIHGNITLHEPCHLGRGQGLSSVVRDVLRKVPGLTLIEMDNADRCCGFGGVMRVSHPELSDSMAEEKAKSIIRTGAAVVATGCPGCRMQIGEGLRRAGSDVRVVHPIQILEEAICNAKE